MSTLDFNIEFWPRQLQAFNTEATELLFGGATEGGKSFFVRAALILWCLEIPNLQCVLVRKKYDDILQNHVEGPQGFRVLLSSLVDKKLVKITDSGVRFLFNNSQIAFQHCQDERQFTSAQGVEKHVLVIDEATQISERLIRFFRAWVRMDEGMQAKLPEKYRGKFPRIIYTANPIGQSVPFFRRNFVEKCKNESIHEIHGFKRQYLLSRYVDNGSISEEKHRGRLEGLGDAQLARALDLGDWNTLVGEFFPEWEESRHVVRDFTPPRHWFRYRAFDWGSHDPFCVLWAAVSDGEPFRDDDGDERWFPRGAIIIYKEWYGCDVENPARGCGMRNEDIARGILDRSDVNEQNVITLADRKPFQDNGGYKISLVFQNAGVLLTPADDSRITGWAAVRDRLIGVADTYGVDKIPMLYVCESCKYVRDYLPALPRHRLETKKEDAEDSGETTHAADTVRYICNAKSVIKDKMTPTEYKIKKVLQGQKVTINKILRGQGHASIN